MAAEEALTGVGELLFSLLIGYLGALECAFVARHLYHWSFRHPSGSSADAAADAEELPRLRERLDKEIKEAGEREAQAGTNVMQDGVLYSNGIRVDPAGEKREALAAELARQQQIEAETRRQLAEAEAKLAEERLRVQREKEEAEEQQRKLVEAERQREREQAEKELQEQREAERRQLEAEESERKQREIEEKERLDNERKLIEAEREREEKERRLQAAEEQREREESERRIIEAERQREQAEAEAERQKEIAEQARLLVEAEAAEAERLVFEAEIQREREQADEEEQDQRDAEIVDRLLAAERELSMSATESELEEDVAIAEQSRRLISSRTDLEQKQRMIEENARRFLEAEEEMVMLQQRQLQGAHSKEEEDEYAGMEPVVEEPCVKKVAPPRFQEPPEEPLMVQKVKTQFGQGSGSEDGYLVKSKTLNFPGVSDEGSSVEPFSSQQSSFSTQPSEGERPEPEGEDQIQDVQYTEDYLRSLDGIKNRPLVREDGSGRRRAFKKRRSSGSSNSSRDSRASRDEELKMFTSLEEEELRHGEREDYNPIKYSSEPTLKVKSHRRHKRSPAKDIRSPTETSGSLEMLGEESTNPWGEVVPEHYKDTEFWKREKALSIDEEEIELERPSRGEDVEDEATNEPKSSSFEEATEAQNEQAVAALKQQLSKEQVDKETEKDNSQAVETSDSNKANTCS
ncbi:trichohyalin isoform X3 [Drosophila suzukii]|uniref:Trichohyalin isoform X3 n=1 Tax=Drosophila suzukii TaxID=28584 RepID=A0AB40A5G0_DROSZ